MNSTDRVQKLLPHQSLQYIGLSASFQSSLSEHVAAVGGQNNNPRLPEFATNGNYGVYATHTRHLQVHQSDIRTMGPELGNRFVAIGCLSNEFHVGLIGDEGGDPFAKESVVVSRENANKIRTGGHGFPRFPFAPAIASLEPPRCSAL